MKTGFIAFMVGVMLVFSTHSQASEYTEGVWTSGKSTPEVPGLKLEVKAPEKKVVLTFLKATNFSPNKVEISFFDTKGNRRSLELKTLDPQRFPMRYEGGLSKAESFVGFEISLPFPKKKPLIVHSKDLQGSR